MLLGMFVNTFNFLPTVPSSMKSSHCKGSRFVEINAALRCGSLSILVALLHGLSCVFTAPLNNQMRS